MAITAVTVTGTAAEARHSLLHAALQRAWRPGAALMLAAFAAPAVLAQAAEETAGGRSAQVPAFTASLGGELSWTDNINQAPAASAESEFSLRVSPSLGVNYRSGRLQVAGTAGLSAYHYFGGAQSDTVYPNIGLTGTYEAVERWLFIDAAVSGSQQFANPFAPQSTNQVSGNSYAAYTYSVSPYVRGKLLGDLDYQLRSASQWASTGGASSLGNAYQWNVDGSIARAPQPFGWSLTAQRQFSKPQGEPDYTNQSARAVLSYRIDESFDLSARGGYEQLSYGGLDQNRGIGGGGFAWRPTPRTDVNGYWERRYFGDGWQFAASHRMPFLALSLGSSRDVSTTPNRLNTVPAGFDVLAALDALLTTRIPDPIARAAAARQLLAQGGLPGQLLAPVAATADNITLQTRYNAAAVIQGARNSLAFSVFYLRTEPLADVLTGLGTPRVQSSVQRGASLFGSHRLDPLTSLTGGIERSDTRGTGINATDRSRQWTYRINLSRELGPRLSGSVGLRYTDYTSNLFDDYHATSALVGLTYTF